MRYFEDNMTYADAKAHHRTLAKQLHPDRGGQHDAFVEMNSQYKQHLESLKVKAETVGNKQEQHSIMEELSGIANLILKSGLPQAIIENKRKSATGFEKVVLGGVISILNSL